MITDLKERLAKCSPEDRERVLGLIDEATRLSDALGAGQRRGRYSRILNSAFEKKIRPIFQRAESILSKNA